MTRTNTRTSRDSSRSEERSSSRDSGGRSESRGPSSKQRSPMLRMGSITFTKKMDPKHQKELRDFLEEIGAQMWVRIYLPNGMTDVSLRSKDQILLNFSPPPFEGTPDFVIGTASLRSDGNE